MTVDELIQKLSEFPPEWRVVATRAGGSLQVWEPVERIDYGFVFTDGRSSRRLKDRRLLAEKAHRKEAKAS